MSWRGFWGALARYAPIQSSEVMQATLSAAAPDVVEYVTSPGCGIPNCQICAAMADVRARNAARFVALDNEHRTLLAMG